MADNPVTILQLVEISSRMFKYSGLEAPAPFEASEEELQAWREEMFPHMARAYKEVTGNEGDLRDMKFDSSFQKIADTVAHLTGTERFDLPTEPEVM